MKIIIASIIGARPQIIKSAAISRLIEGIYSEYFEEIVIHTGQHYDANMSDIFFQELGISKPRYNLGISSSLHGQSTGDMIVAIEKLLLEIEPHILLVYGDTNSTLAGSIAASKMDIPIVHVEAGLRSFDKEMPEEINRILCDHSSTLLFSPTIQGLKNLFKEGFCEDSGPYHVNKPGVFHCGDVMLDNALFYKDYALKATKDLFRVPVSDRGFVLATIHRPSNTDSVDKLKEIFSSFLLIIEKYRFDVICPLHPRTRDRLVKYDKSFYDLLLSSSGLYLLEPVSYLEMIALENRSTLVITDSGGVQKEAYFFKKPCVILRKQTEWVEILETGTSILSDSNFEVMSNAIDTLLGNQFNFPPLFGDGNAAKFILNTIKNNFESPDRL